MNRGWTPKASSATPGSTTSLLTMHVCGKAPRVQWTSPSCDKLPPHPCPSLFSPAPSFCSVTLRQVWKRTRWERQGEIVANPNLVNRYLIKISAVCVRLRAASGQGRFEATTLEDSRGYQSSSPKALIKNARMFRGSRWVHISWLGLGAAEQAGHQTPLLQLSKLAG